MYRKALIAALCLCLLLAGYAGMAETALYCSASGSFTGGECASCDGKYIARLYTGSAEGGDPGSVYAEILDAETGEAAARVKTGHTPELCGICWDRENYDIYVQSADVSVLRFEGGEWREEAAARVPDYILTRRDVSAVTELCASLVGRHRSDVLGEYDHIGSNFLDYIRTGSGYAVLGNNWDEITHAVGYDRSGMPVCSVGTYLLSAQVFDAAQPADVAQLIECFGYPNVNDASGLYIPVYYIDDGRIAAYWDGGDALLYHVSTVPALFKEFPQLVTKAH